MYVYFLSDHSFGLRSFSLSKSYPIYFYPSVEHRDRIAMSSIEGDFFYLSPNIIDHDYMSLKMGLGIAATTQYHVSSLLFPHLNWCTYGKAVSGTIGNVNVFGVSSK